MLLVGLTGGIGSGKSTVARLLAENGALVVDADDLARDAIAPGSPGSREVAERFPRAISVDGTLDRSKLAEIVFSDAEAREDLEAIVHPEVRRLFGEFVEANSSEQSVIVFAAPLLVETGAAAGFDALVVVTAPEEARLSRLAESRGMSGSDARARMAAQAGDTDRIEAADILIDNGGSLVQLEQQVRELWAELSRRSAG